MLLADIRIFVAIVDAGGFTAAAKSLSAPKSSVARQLARLEESLGRALIARSTRSVGLTEEGRTFLPYARRLLDDETEARNILRAGPGGASGLVTVSAPATFGRMFLAPRLPEFRRRHPHVQVFLRLTAQKTPIGVGEADIAFRLGALVEPGLASRPLGRLEYALVAAPGYLKRRKTLRDPIALAGLDFIELRPPADDHRLTLKQGDAEETLRYVPGIRMDDPEGVKAAALAGGGVAALPLFLVEDEVRRGALVRVLPGWAPPPAPIHVVYAARQAPPLRVRAFLAFIQAIWADGAPWSAKPASGARAPVTTADRAGIAKA